MDRVFVYWDNSNIFIGARAEAEEREGAAARPTADPRYAAPLDLSKRPAAPPAGGGLSRA